MKHHLDKYFQNEKLLMIPKKQAVKREVFSFFHDLFETDQTYSEQEVNEVIKPYYDDYAIIRRYLVDYKYLERDKFGQVYQKVRKDDDE